MKQFLRLFYAAAVAATQMYCGLDCGAAKLPPYVWGYIDRTGKWSIPPRFEHAEPFDDGVACVTSYKDFGDDCALIDKTGKVVLKVKAAHRCAGFAAGLTAVPGADGKFGFINKTGAVIFPDRFDAASAFNEGLAAVKVASCWGFIGKDGKFLVKPQYKQTQDFSEGLAAVRDSADHWLFIDKAGKVVISPQTLQGKSVRSFHDGLAQFDDANHREGFIDKTGRVVVKSEFAIASDFHDGLAWVLQKWAMDAGPGSSQYGAINTNGKFVIPPSFDEVEDFSEGLASVKRGDQRGYVDHSGKYISARRFSEAHSFHEGLALVLVPYDSFNTWEFIDKTGKTVISLKSSFVGDFSEGLAPASQFVRQQPSSY